MTDATEQAAHTPGPWGWNHDNNWLEAPDPTFPDRDDYGHIVMEAASAEMMPSKADARLVAAAPELLEAAHNAKETINSMYVQLGSPDNLKPLMEQLTDAVAKAKGGPR